MQVVTTIAALRALLKNQSSIAFVPTMGNLHAGHIHLVRIAKQHASCVVVSIFVNPLQFGPQEDLASYPRTLAADCEKLKAAGADFVFTPEVAEIYPDVNGTDLGQSMRITTPPIAQILCGAARPGHFDGVATVVMKLLNIVQPQFAVFGKKDFQQLAIIRALIRQFNVAVEIIAGETIREESGLAMSSRNGYLSPQQQIDAAALQQQLLQIVGKIQAGEQDFNALAISASAALEAQGWQVDYVSIRASLTLAPATTEDTALVVLAAAKLGSTRLIDNIDFLR